MITAEIHSFSDYHDTLVSRIFGTPDSLKDSANPLYLQLQGLIQQAIDSNLLERGSALPPEREIAQYMRVSRVTVKRAISELVTAGLLVQRQGAGTFVAERVEKPFSRLSLRSLTSIDQYSLK